MKILLYTDVHFSQYASIVRGRGEKYSIRLENLIKSINWAEDLASKQKCDAIFILGDFFDKSEIVAEELTALGEIKWANLSHVFLVGNHDMSRSSLELSSSHLFNLCPKTKVIDTPTSYKIDDGEVEICFLPYIVNPQEPIKYYLNLENEHKRRIVLSHNDIKGINYGAFVSKSGFDIKDIEQFCTLFLNGHLHDKQDITYKIKNIGSLSAHNFSNDSFKYSYGATILDTSPLNTHIEFYENPYSFNFYKIEAKDVKDCEAKLNKTKQNSVVTIKCLDKYLTDIKALLPNYNNIVESRVVIELDTKTNGALLENKSVEFNKVDHIKTFKEYITSTLGNSDIINEELGEISK